jgi:subtilisin family serine protease
MKLINGNLKVEKAIFMTFLITTSFISAVIISTSPTIKADDEIFKFSEPIPLDGSNTSSITWSIFIEHTEEKSFDTSIEVNKNAGNISENKGTNGMKTIMNLNLTYNTTYTVYVNVTDGDNTENKTYTFKTDNVQYLFKPGEFTIKFEEEANLNFSQSEEGWLQTGISSIDDLNEKYKIVSAKNFSLNNTYIFERKYDNITNLLGIINDYEKNENVIFADLNYVFSSCATVPNDPGFDSQWGLNQSSDADIDCPEAWDIETGNEAIVIAVIDTGVDWNHPDLNDNIWINTNEIDNNGIDDDGNGYIDDIRGWNFVSNTNNVMDDNGHGTHCSGIIAAETNNSIGVAGVSWNCTIMPVKCLNEEGGGDVWSITNAIVYSVDNGANILSMSLGGPYPDPVVLSAVEYAYDAGCIIVAAAGNLNTSAKSFPAAFDNVIAVAATNETDEKAFFSNFGYWIDIAAPGVNINSTIWNDNYEKHNGTSMACPHVSGLASLILTKNSSLNPDQVRSVIKVSCDSIDADEYIGSGRINAYNALLRDTPPIFEITSPNQQEIVEDIIDINGSAAGSTFSNYSIYFGPGLYPTNWTSINYSTTPVINGTLAIWNTSLVNDGYYTIKLEVNDTGGYNWTATILVLVDNVPAKIRYVGGTGPGNYSTIQTAIDDCDLMDTVYVYDDSSPYNETITIPVLISLIGENKYTTVIDRRDVPPPEIIMIQSDADGTVISGFTIKNTSLGSNNKGIDIEMGSNSNTITDNIFENCYHGVYAPSSNNNISDNIFINSTIAIRLGDPFPLEACKQNLIQNNYINGAITGILAQSWCDYNDIINNNISNITNSGIELTGGVVGTNHNLNNITLNKITGTVGNGSSQGVGLVLLSIFGYIIEQFINKNTISKFNQGAYMYANTGNTFVFNNFINNYYGHFGGSDNIEISFQWSGYGNYWDDYTGNDTNGDGIGETAYLALKEPTGAEFYDNYPLIHRFDEPFAKFTFSTNGRAITFNSSTSFDFTTNIVNWSWDFGDDNISYDQNPMHIYVGDAGDYNVTLIVRNEFGNTNTTKKTLTVYGIRTKRTLEEKWNIAALPFDQSIFKEYGIIKFNNSYYTWNNAVNNSIIVGILKNWNRSLQDYENLNYFYPGYGYWTFSNETCDMLFFENSSTDTINITECLDDWNLIGLPFDISLSKEQIIVVNNSIEYNWSEAVDEGIIDDHISDWVERKQRYVYVNTLHPNRGYWVFSYYDDCILTRNTSRSGKSNGGSDNKFAEWELQLNIFETNGRKSYVILGHDKEGKNSNEGPDDFDIPLCPSHTRPYVRSWFDTNMKYPYNVLIKEINKKDKSTKVWKLNISWAPASPYKNTSMNITWNLSVSKNGYSTLTLIDHSNAVKIDMIKHSHYNYLAIANTTRSFSIVAN